MPVTHGNGMYNKLFSKIIRSSIWLEPTPTRMVWITLLAVMNEDGFAEFASIKNLSHTARIDLADAESAVQILEAPDVDSSDKDHEGRRIERVPGGWIVLNAVKYREIVTRAVAKELNRERVRRYRERKVGNGDVTPSNVRVMQSEAEADTDTYAESEALGTKTVAIAPVSVSENWEFVGKVPSKKPIVAVTEATLRVFDHWRTVHRHPNAKLDNKRLNIVRRALDDYTEGQLCESISGYCNSPHHMGQNEKATVYDDIGLLLRDSQHIDAGLRFFAEPPRADLSEKTRRIVSQTEGWMPFEERKNAGK